MIRPLMWAILAGVALALGYGTQSAVLAWVGYTMIAVLALGYGVMRLSTGRLYVERELTADRVYPGDSVGVHVRVENHSPLPALWLVAAESLPAGLPVTGVRGRVATWVGRGGFSFTYMLEGARRGYHEIGPTALHVGDPFGLFQRRLELGGSSWLTVFPKLVALQHPRVSSPRVSGEVRVRRRVLEDPTVTVGIRPYQYGDGMKRVHWRATAHTGRLQSKLFEITAQHDVTLLLDLRRADYPTSPEEAGQAAELAITTAASIAQYLLGGMQRVGLLALARDPSGMGGEALVSVAPGRGRAHLVQLLSTLGRVELGRTEGLTEVLGRQKERFPWGSMVVVIAPGVDRELMVSLLNLRTCGYGVKLVLVGRNASTPGGADPRAVGMGAVRVQSEEAIRGLDL